ncbi:hypothetical protein F6455_12910 [Proteobacteria bacterium 005FR1]|nr:hypothetical protein [Proteobacteria bacterium 005FR1]
MGSGERGWRVESGEWRVESGEWRVESGEWRVESGEWRVERSISQGPQSTTFVIPAQAGIQNLGHGSVLRSARCSN